MNRKAVRILVSVNNLKYLYIESWERDTLGSMLRESSKEIQVQNKHQLVTRRATYRNWGPRRLND
jgi:hypothetical protein